MNPKPHELDRRFYLSSLFLTVLFSIIFALNPEWNLAEEIPDIKSLLNEVLQRVDRLPSGYEKAHTLTEIARLQAKAKDRIGFEKTLLLILKEIDDNASKIGSLFSGLSFLIQEIPWKISQLIQVSSLQVSVGDKQGATATLQKASESIESLPADSPYWAETAMMTGLQDIAAEQMRLGDRSGSQATLKKLFQFANFSRRPEYYQSKATLGLALNYFEAKDHDSFQDAINQARDIAEKSDSGTKTKILTEMAVIFARTGHQAEAIRLLKEVSRPLPDAIEENSRGSDHETVYLLNDVYPWVVVADAQQEAGDREAASKTIDHALKLKDVLKNKEQKSAALRDLVIAQARLGDIEGARRSYSEITDPDYRVGSEYILMAEIKNGDLEGALETLKTFEWDGPRWEAYLAAIGEAKARKGDITGALEITNNLRPYGFGNLRVNRAIVAAKASSGEIKEAIAMARAQDSYEGLLGVIEGMLAPRSQ